MTIPSIAHFVWLGGPLSAVGWLSVRAALDRSGLQAVWLHGDREALAGDPLVQNLLTLPGFALHDMDAGPRSAPDAASRVLLDQLDRLLARPAARSDLWRLRILWQHGGVYLDADAVTLHDLRPLLSVPGFAGLERVCLPAAVVHSRMPGPWLRAGVLIGVRDVISRLPRAGRAFAMVERFYDLACNNAVLGATPNNPTIGRLLQAATALELRQALKLYELGPRLLETVTGNRSTPDFVLHPPATFYPLAPEVCADYVRDDPRARLGDRPHAHTLAAHLYDSVLARRVGPLNARWLGGPGRRTLLGRMVAPWLDELAGLA